MKQTPISRHPLPKVNKALSAFTGKLSVPPHPLSAEAQKILSEVVGKLQLSNRNKKICCEMSQYLSGITNGMLKNFPQTSVIIGSYATSAGAVNFLYTLGSETFSEKEGKIGTADLVILEGSDKARALFNQDLPLEMRLELPVEEDKSEVDFFDFSIRVLTSDHVEASL